MLEKQENRKPYEQAYFPPVPSKFTKFMRTCVLWQFIRFLKFNLMITKLLIKSHH